MLDRGEAEVLADRDAQAAEIDRLQVRADASAAGQDSGSRGSVPAMTPWSSAVSATVRPMAPWTLSGDQPIRRSSWGTAPGLGRKPTTPQ
jgi:hypothetical protein